MSGCGFDECFVKFRPPTTLSLSLSLSFSLSLSVSLSLFRMDFVYDLFAHMNVEEQADGGGGAFRMDRKARRGKKKTTVSSQFKVLSTSHPPTSFT